MKYPIALILFFSVSDLHAHSEKIHQIAWNWDWPTLGSLMALTSFYYIGQKNLQRENSEFSAIKKWQKNCYYLGIISLFVAIVSPLSVLSDYLSSAHMIQHMIIMMIAAPLFVLGGPLFVFLWALPVSLRKKLVPVYKWLYGKRSGRYFLWQPMILWFFYAFILWVWHLPSFYQAALKYQRLHDFQHICFFVAACLFGRVLLDPFHRLRLEKSAGILYLFMTSVHATLLGVFMTLSPKLWYPYYQERTGQWKLSPLEDQQIAGLIMWMPACTVYLFLAVYLFIRWTSETTDKSCLTE